MRIAFAGAALSAALLLGCDRPVMVSAPRFGGGRLVTSERIRLECRGRKGAPRCSLAARYDVAADPEAGADIRIAATPDVGLEVAANGRRSTAEATAWRPSADDPVGGWSFPTPEFRTYAIAAGTSRIEVNAKFRPEPPPEFFFAQAAIARHWAMARWVDLKPCQFHSGGCRYEVNYYTALDRERTPGAVLDTGFAVPPEWSGSAQRERGREVTTIHTGADVFAPGGPFIAAGALVVPRRELRLMAGYEIFAPSWVAHALALEWRGNHEAWVAPSIELASPAILLVPSFGAGVGFPLRLAPSVVPSLRVQASIHWPLVGVVALVDVREDGAPPEVSVLGRFAL